MNLTYFYDTTTYDEAKKVYRKKVLELHPDKNPLIDINLIQQLNEQWSYIQSNSNVFPIVNPVKKEPINKAEPTKLERQNIIKALYKIHLGKGYKPNWVYHQYIAECNYHGVKIKKEDIEFIGQTLGYSEGWTYYKCKELEL